MCRLQIIDFRTKKKIVEEEYDDFKKIDEFLAWVDECGESEVVGCFITDADNRTYECEYRSYSVCTYDKDIVVKVYFDTKYTLDVHNV